MTKEFETIINSIMFPTPRARAFVNSGTSYPPYNIVRLDEENTVLEMALAGFKESELDIVVEDGNLRISARKEEISEGTQYIYKGIGTRAFEKVFTLASNARVDSADFTDGILSIRVSYEIPEEKKPKKILIGKQPGRELLTE
jgi:molecular chaperone IbpA